jgi:diguanylate cyclase (GGDEF)-like protein/PAS domain S-box-containing protein
MTSRYREWFLLASLLVTAVVWGIHWTATEIVARAAERNLADRLVVDAAVLESQVTRSLDVVSGVLRSATTIADRRLLNDSTYATTALSNLIGNVSAVRSISLIDDDGRIIASSTASNRNVTLAVADIPQLRQALQPGAIIYGEAFALRDLYELKGDRTPVELGFWTALKQVEIDGRSYRWLAAINLGIFRNLWDSIDADVATGIHLIDNRGRLIASHRSASPTVITAAVEAILSRLDSEGQGALEIGPSSELVAFRSSSSYPAVMVVTGNSEIVRASGIRRVQQAFIGFAAVANLLLLALIWLLFVVYRRYDMRSQELETQSRAVDLHLMTSESDQDGTIIRGNAAFFTLNGYAPEELIGQSYSVLSTDSTPFPMKAAIWTQLRSGLPWKGTVRNRKKSGEMCWVNATIVPALDADGKVARFITLMTDVTESVALSEAVVREKHLRQELVEQNTALSTDANSDPLTGLANKRALDIFLEQARQASAKDGRALSILMLDIDYFKKINDTRGHAAGDAVLKTLGLRWARELRGSDMLARVGGDEFCVVLPRTPAEQASRIAEKLRIVTSALPVEIAIGSEEVVEIPVATTIGIATTGNSDKIDLSTLQRLADEALYDAKRAGRNRVVLKLAD